MDQQLSTQRGRHVRQKRGPKTPTRNIAPDCRYYHGDRPCVYNQLCKGCQHYAPYDYRICIIKLGALGDVIRTLCILPELYKRHPGAHITWVSMPNGCRMIEDHEKIDRVVTFDPLSVLPLQHEQFDLVINLDKEPQPCALAMSLKAKEKLGIGLSKWGTPEPIDPCCEAYFQLGLSDEMKFCENTKSYPHLVYEALGMHYENQRYKLPVNQKAADRVRVLMATLGWRPGMATIGIFVGAGFRFANKMWTAQKTADIVRELRTNAVDAQILLLGGPDERRIIDQVMQELKTTGHDQCVVDTGTEYDEKEFVALIDLCHVVLCGDTMAMHVAIARKKGVVAYFGPTCEQEIDLFGLGEKLVADVTCGPCYKRTCDQNDQCVEQIKPHVAAAAVMRVLNRQRQGSIALPQAPRRQAA